MIMECNWLVNNLGYDCRPVPGNNGGRVLEIDTPFSFLDGEPLSLYVLEQGSNIVVSDNGDTMAHLIGSGLNMANRRGWSVIRSRIEPHNMMLTDAGEIRALGSIDYASGVIAGFISGLLAVVDYERQNLGAPGDINILADEVEMLLRAWRPAGEIARRPQIKGMSQRKHTFDFQLDNTLVDAVAPNAAAVGGVMRKIGDVLSSPYLSGRELMVVIDDRADPGAASMERDIVTALAKTVLYTDLADLSHRGGTAH